MDSIADLILLASQDCRVLLFVGVVALGISFIKGWIRLGVQYDQKAAALEVYREMALGQERIAERITAASLAKLKEAGE